MKNTAYSERLSFYEDTVACRRTDRILAAPLISYLPMSLYGGVTFQDAMEDHGRAHEVYLRYHQEYLPDLAHNLQSIMPVGPLDVLDCTYIRWPGKHFEGPNRGYQVLDNEFMLQEEYDEYIEDPTGFILRKALPRHYGKLKGLEVLDFSNAVWRGALHAMIPFSTPPVRTAVDAMSKAGALMADIVEKSREFTAMMAANGWPLAIDYSMQVPFDIFNDTLRGFINTTMDMLECPDKLLAALAVSTRIQVRNLKRHMENVPTRTVCFFIHNGMDNFMSLEQFKTFYWPGMKAVVEAVLEMGGIPKIYTEGNYESRLDLFSELPPGKVIIHFVGTDMEKVKEKLSGKICVSGGVNGAMLQFGSKDDVIANVKRAVDICAPGGGYILDCDVNLDIAKPENLHAMFDTARSYMKY